MPEIATKTFPFKIGADPEFLLFYGDKHINAGQVIPKFMDGKFTKTEMGFNIGEHGNFGWDGSSPTGEIRPKESNDVDVLTNNIGELFKAAHNAMPLFDMSTLSIGRPAGGHFHVDVPREFTNNERLLTRIRKIVSVLLIPVIASEHKLSSMQRTKGSGYGNLTDIRVHTEGSMMTYELRGPSSEWLVSEKICRSTVAYIGVIWNEILKNHAALAKNDIVFKNLPQAKAIQDMIIADYKPFANSLTDLIAREVKKFELYPQFKDEVDFILNPQAVQKEKEAVGWNINRGWNLKGESKVTKRELNAKTKIKEKVKAMNIELLTGTFGISYNDDYNVALFANAISERIAALNWNLSNEYFLFGLKKGTNGFLVGPAMQFIKNDAMPLCHLMPNNIAKADSVKAMRNIATKVKNIAGSVVKISPQTGKAFAGVSNTVLIGIPYDIRAEENIKPLIDIIYDIENEKLKAQPIDKFEATVISNKEEKNLDELISSLGTNQQGLHSEANEAAIETITENYQTVETPSSPDTEDTAEYYDEDDNEDNE